MNHFGVNEILKNRSNPLLKRLNKDEDKRHGQEETGREDAQTNECPLRGRLTICLQLRTHDGLPMRRAKRLSS